MAIEKMNVYIISKDKVQVAKKEGKWFKDLFLPLFKSNKDPLGKQPKLDDYWKEIRDCLIGKKKNKNLKVIKHKDLKFIAFNVKHGTILAFATGNEKSDSLNDIYKIAQEKSEEMTYEKFLILSKATDSPAVLDKYNNLVQEEITDKQAKEWGYKNIEDLVKNGCNSVDSDIDHPYIGASSMGTIIDISNWGIKEWANEIIEKIKPLVKDEDITGVYEDAEEMSISSKNDRNFGTWLIATFLEFSVMNANGQDDDASFEDIVKYYGNKEVIDNQHKIEEEVAAYFIKDSLMFKKKSLHKTSYVDLVNWLSDHEKAFKDYCERFNVDFNNFDPDHLEILNLPSPDKTMSWLMEHETLYSDFLYHFNYEDDAIKDLDATKYINYDIVEDRSVMALEENKSESLAEVEHDFVTGLINYEDAVDTIMELGEANTTSDAQAIVDAWELKNKKDTGKDKYYKFEVEFYKTEEPFEDFDEYKKWEHHFEYIYGDTNPGDYWDIKVEDHTNDKKEPYIKVTGKMSGVSKEDFEGYLFDGKDSYGFDDLVVTWA